MSEGQPSSQSGAAAESQPASRKLRRRPFGYRTEDVREALEARDAELSARASELGARAQEIEELRQDVAALWLAFAQHDRMIRSALGDAAAAPASSPEEPAAPPPASEPPPGEDQAPAGAAASDPAIGRQLSELDDVLAAIELATQTLERTYAEEITDTGEGPAGEEPAPEEPDVKDEAS